MSVFLYINECLLMSNSFLVTFRYTNYELVRIKSLELQLESAVQNIPRDMSDVDKQWVATKFYPKQLVLTESLQRLQTALESQPELDTITQEFEVC